MAVRQVYDNVVDLSELVWDLAPLRECGGCTFSVGQWNGLLAIVFDEREMPSITSNEPVVVLAYGNPEEWLREVDILLDRLDAIPATRRLGNWGEDGGMGIPVLAGGGPPPARGPGLKRTIAEALEPPRNP